MRSLLGIQGGRVAGTQDGAQQSVQLCDLGTFAASL